MAKIPRLGVLRKFKKGDKKVVVLAGFDKFTKDEIDEMTSNIPSKLIVKNKGAWSFQFNTTFHMVVIGWISDKESYEELCLPENSLEDVDAYLASVGMLPAQINYKDIGIDEVLEGL